MRNTPRATHQAGFRAALVPMTFAVVLGCALAGPTFAQDEPSAASAAERLREAWVLHRLEGKIDEAEPRYLALFDDESVDPDLRLRAGIGLGILERGRGSESQANRWFVAAYQVPGAATRWVRAAFELLPSPGSRLELEAQVEALSSDIALVRETLSKRERELDESKNRIAHLERRTAVNLVKERREGEQRSAATRFADSLVIEDREDRALRHSIVRGLLLRSREHLTSGRFLNALNEVKTVLRIDPKNHEAQELAWCCNRYLTEVSGRGPVPPQSSITHNEQDPTRFRIMIEQAMGAYLEEGQRLYRLGKTKEALEHFQTVLEEFILSPDLREEVVNTIVSPAYAQMRQCLEELGPGAELQATWARQKELDEVLKNSLDDLLERLRRDDPAIELERLLGIARRDREAGQRNKAISGFEKAWKILGENPALDTKGLKKSVADELTELRENAGDRKQR